MVCLTIWRNMTRLAAYVVTIFNVVWIEGILSVVKILVQRTFFMLRSVFALALGLFSLPLNIFGLCLLVFDS